MNIEYVVTESAAKGQSVLSDDSELESEHPAMDKVFNNQLLLDNIFEQVEDSSVELRICRLVNQQWKRRATVCLRENNWAYRNFLVLKDIEAVKKYINTLASSKLHWPCNSDNEFLQYGLALESSPINLDESQLFECYDINLQLPYHGDNFVLHTQILVLFFRVFPQSIRSLNLNMTFTVDLDIPISLPGVLAKILESQSTSLSELRLEALIYDEDIQKFYEDNNKKPDTLEGVKIPSGGYKLVNLDYLCLRIRKCDKFGHKNESAEPVIPSECMLKILEILLNKIPEDKSVKICLLNWNYMKETINLLKKYDQVQNLKVLKLNNDEEAQELKSLGECGVQLDILDTFVGTYTQNIYDFLCTQLNSLKQLSWGSEWRFKFPHRPMVALEKLRLSCFKIVAENEQNSPAEITWNQNCRPVLYDLFPKLEELYFDVYYSLSTPDEFNSWFLSPQLPCPSVKKFEINYFSGLNARILGSISNTFTHLKSLKIHRFYLESKIEEQEFFHTLWGASFSSTIEDLSIQLTNCEEQRNLETSWRKYELDSLFSGVKEEIIEQIDQSGEFNACPSNNNSILNYKSLTALAIVDDCVVSEHGIFTDFSAYCIFGRLEKLGFLGFSTQMWNFSKAASTHLQNKLLAVSSISIPDHHSSPDRLEHFFCESFENFHSFNEGTVSFRDLNLDQSA